MLKRAVLIIDSPNLARRAVAEYGEGARVDFAGLKTYLESLVDDLHAEVVVNKGASDGLVRWLSLEGYVVTKSTADDCDETGIARLADLGGDADCVVIGSGDHIFSGIARMLQRLGVSVVVAAIPGSISRRLRESCDAVIDCPVLRGRLSARAAA